MKDILNEIVWNNKNILLNKKSCYYSDLAEAGIHRSFDVVKTDGVFVRGRICS